MAGIGISADYKTPWVLELHWMVAVVGLINLYLLAVECIGIGIVLLAWLTRGVGVKYVYRFIVMRLLIHCCPISSDLSSLECFSTACKGDRSSIILRLIGLLSIGS